MQVEASPSKSARHDREMSLWRAFKDEGSAEAREHLFALYIGLARRLARRHFLDRNNRTIEFADLCQLAYAGLLEAIDRFDPAFGVGFGHYAGRRIAGSIVDGVRRASEVHEQMSFRSRVRRERSKSLAGDNINDLSSAEALDRLVEAAVGVALGFMLEGTDILMPEGAADRSVNAYESLAWKEAFSRAVAEVDELPERERLIIRQHYFHGIDFEHIGSLMRVSKGRVSQLHRAALMRMKKRLNSNGQFSLER